MKDRLCIKDLGGYGITLRNALSLYRNKTGNDPFTKINGFVYLTKEDWQEYLGYRKTIRNYTHTDLQEAIAYVQEKFDESN